MVLCIFIIFLSASIQNIYLDTDLSPLWSSWTLKLILYGIVLLVL